MLDDFRDEEVNNSGEFLDEFRQRLNSQPLENVDERRATVGRSQQIFLSAILGIGLAGIVSWFIFSPEYSKIENTEIPVVRRPQTMVKVQPAEPGGMEIHDQDKTIYDIVEKKEATEEKVENLLPPPEAPILLEFETNEDAVDDGIIKEAEKILQRQDIAEEAHNAEQVAVAEVAKVEAETVPVKEEEVVSKTKDDFVKEVKKTETLAIKKDDIPAGSWQVQLISSPNSSAVDKAWKDLKRKYPALGSLPHEVETADLGSKGVFYRLMVGSFVDRGDADKLCNTIKNSGGTCLVKKK